MTPNTLLWPMLALVGWTFVVLLMIPWRRFRAAFAGEVTVEDFRYGESARVPAHVSMPNRNFMNLLEVPVLFYVVCLTLHVTQQATPLLAGLAWVYVSLRVLHSVVHLGYNHVLHRLALFASSNVVLALMWGLLLGRLLG